MRVVMLVVVGTSSLAAAEITHSGAVAQHCDVMIHTTAVVKPGTATLTVQLENSTAKPTTVTLATMCGAPYVLHGAPKVTCPPSPCRASPPRTYRLRGKQKLRLGTTRIVAAGDRCHAELATGPTVFAAVATATDAATVCAGRSAHVIRDPASKQLRAAQPGRDQ